MPEPTFAPSPLHRCLIEHATLVDLIGGWKPHTTPAAPLMIQLHCPPVNRRGC